MKQIKKVLVALGIVCAIGVGCSSNKPKEESQQPGTASQPVTSDTQPINDDASLGASSAGRSR
jgi:predicted component of type VI protein secretion system